MDLQGYGPFFLGVGREKVHFMQIFGSHENYSIYKDFRNSCNHELTPSWGLLYLKPIFRGNFLLIIPV